VFDKWFNFIQKAKCFDELIGSKTVARIFLGVKVRMAWYKKGVVQRCIVVAKVVIILCLLLFERLIMRRTPKCRIFDRDISRAKSKRNVSSKLVHLDVVGLLLESVELHLANCTRSCEVSTIVKILWVLFEATITNGREAHLIFSHILNRTMARCTSTLKVEALHFRSVKRLMKLTILGSKHTAVVVIRVYEF